MLVHALRRALCALVVAATAVMVPLAGATVAPDSGVSGQVRSTAGRGLRVEARLVARVAATGHMVARGHTARVGRFRMRLRPGRYTIEATVPGIRAQARQTVTVRPHRFTLVVLVIQMSRRDAAGGPPPRPPY